MYARAASSYRRVDLDSAPKSEIMMRLFARCLDDINAARTAIAAKDIHAKAKSLDHAIQIVVELRAALDHKAAPDLAARLDGLYGFVVDQLTLANVKVDVQPLVAATRVMSELADAFGTARTQP
jgi:flagellar secretion chaperone FliS